MIYIALMVIALMGAMGMVSAKEEVPPECDASAVTKPFFRMAAWLERLLRKSGMNRKLFSANEEKYRMLEPAADAGRSAKVQFVKKCALCFLILTGGMIFVLIISYSEENEELLSADGSMLRREYGKGKYTVELDADVGGELNTVDVVVEERAFTETETAKMLPGFREKLEKAVLGKNKDADHVDTDLDLVSGIKGYPFTVEWDIGNREAFNRMGEIKEGIPEEGSLCTLTAHISYGEYEEQHSFSVMAYPKQLSAPEKLGQAIDAAISEAAEKSKSDERFILPSQVDGIRVVWQERKKSSAAILMVMVAAALVVVFKGRDKDLDKKLKERDMELEADYPEMVSKLSLYIGAGMSTRMAWRKMVEEYKQKGVKRYVYEEMLLCCREMDRGMSEMQAYQLFAKRCRLQKYVKLISLLEQNSRLGAAGFLGTMRSECRDALQERKANARRLGEEAGTKLLLPMIMMLAIVMVVIIVPAFVSI